MTKPLCSILLLALASGACVHTKIARQDLERRGCTDITLQKTGGKFKYAASCGAYRCSGTMTVHGTRFKYTMEDESFCTNDW